MVSEVEGAAGGDPELRLFVGEEMVNELLVLAFVIFLNDAEAAGGDGG